MEVLGHPERLERLERLEQDLFGEEPGTHQDLIFLMLMWFLMRAEHILKLAAMETQEARLPMMLLDGI